MSKLGGNFYPKLVQVASEVGMAPEDLVAVMISESGMNPGIGNPNGGAIGLIQFMPNTLKGLDFKGTSKDFGQLDGEAQLDWIKKYILNQTKMNGGPFTSAAQYYVANFFPVALKLPGIKKGNPATVFVEENPATVDIKGIKYSKKYYDIGIKLRASSEIAAYKANPGFHGTVPGAIAYADMIKQIEKNKKNPKYTQALAAMKRPMQEQPARYIAQTPTNNNSTPSKTMTPVNYTTILDKFLTMVAEDNGAALRKQSRLLNNATKFVIRLSSDNLIDTIEYSRILAMVAREELQAKSDIHAGPDGVDVVVAVPGKGNNCFETLNELNEAVKDTFKMATKKIGSIQIKSHILFEDNSEFEPLNSKVACSNYRQFLLKFVGK